MAKGKAAKRIRIDGEWLDGLGLEAMPDEDKQLLVGLAKVELEKRVGSELASGLTPEELERFDQLHAAGQTKAARKFVKQLCPDHRKKVRAQYRQLEDEIRQDRDLYLIESETAQHWKP